MTEQERIEFDENVRRSIQEHLKLEVLPEANGITIQILIGGGIATSEIIRWEDLQRAYKTRLPPDFRLGLGDE